MPPPRIQALSGRGQAVGAEFVKRFDSAKPDPDCKLNWPNHRWVRLRSTLSALEEFLLKMDRSCAQPLNGDLAYDVWVQTADNAVLPSYRWRPVSPANDWRYQRLKAEDMLAALRDCSQALQTGQPDPMPLATGAPRPRPDLCVRPRI